MKKRILTACLLENAIDAQRIGQGESRRQDFNSSTIPTVLLALAFVVHLINHHLRLALGSVSRLSSPTFSLISDLEQIKRGLDGSNLNTLSQVRKSQEEED